MAKSKELLPKDRFFFLFLYLVCNNHSFISSSMWPIFFERSLWNKINQICTVMSAVVGLCVSPTHNGFSQYNMRIFVIGEKSAC